MDPIKIAIVGVGNCASSLVQGLEYYRDKQPEEAIGLMHWEVGGYRPYDIEVVTAFDIDERLHDRIVYHAAALANREPGTMRFLDLLCSKSAGAVFERLGFKAWSGPR